MWACRPTAIAAALAVVALSWLGAGRAAREEPDVVVVQHILIGFEGSVRGKSSERTKKEAKALADELLLRARSGAEDFDALVQRYTDDRHPGIYKLTNRGAPRMNGAYPRDDMAGRFGDVAFSLAVGEFGLAEYSATASPYGWHLIKRLE